MRFGDPALPDLFWAKVQVTDSGCWQWIASTDKDGYGRYRLPGDAPKPGCVTAHNWLTHRLTFSKMRESIPAGHQIDHLCRNRGCCNPDHLEVVTLRENVDRGDNYIAHNRRKTHCPQGHEYVGENLVIKINHHGTESRVCRACRNRDARDYQRERRARLKASR